MIEYFSSYVQEGGDASLVLMGIKLMPLPEEARTENLPTAEPSNDEPSETDALDPEDMP